MLGGIVNIVYFETSDQNYAPARQPRPQFNPQSNFTPGYYPQPQVPMYFPAGLWQRLSSL